MRVKKYIETIAHDDHRSIYGEKARVFTLKPKEQIPDLYSIIEYKEHQEATLDDEDRRIPSEEEDDDHIPVSMKVELCSILARIYLD